MHGGGWPENELEQVLGAALGQPEAGARILEVLGRSPLWVPLPGGGGPDHDSLSLPTMEIGGAAYVPVYSSESQFRACVGPGMDFAVAPAVEFARGLPPQLGIAVNPEGAVGVPLPPPAVAELCRTGRTPSTAPPPAAACGCSSPTGRTTPSTSWPPPPRSSAPPAWSSPRTAASAASRAASPSCSSASG
ncbi:hypothetical protein GCM10020254_29030 [Streptomyces goshikiensis]